MSVTEPSVPPQEELLHPVLAPETANSEPPDTASGGSAPSLTA